MMKANDLIVLTDRGLYCADGDFYIDPWKPVPLALLTHGHSDHARSGSARYIAEKTAYKLIRHRLGEAAVIDTVNYRDQMRLGTTTVSFHPAGHILGSSQIRVERDSGEVWVFTGDYKRDEDPTCAPFEVLECDTLITEATFALPIYKWKNTRIIVRDIYEWWMMNRARGYNSILCAYALGKAQRILAELLHFTREPVYLHGAMETPVELYRDAGVSLIETVSTSGITKKDAPKGGLIIATPGAAASTWTRKFEPYEVAFASGWMQVRGNKRRDAYDRGFVISDHSDWLSLLRTIRETKAKRVIATHGFSETLARYVREEMNLAGEVFETNYGEEEVTSTARPDNRVSRYEESQARPFDAHGVAG